MAELGALEAMAVQGAQEAMAELGALEAMADGLQPELILPPPPNFPGEVRGYQEPSGAKQTGQYKQDGKAFQGQTDRTGQPTGTGSPPGLFSEAEASLGHDESGALTGSLSNRFHLCDKGGRQLEWPPQPQNKEPPAPDESP